MDTFFFFAEIVGTIAFALSGTLKAIQKRLDIFGVCTLAICTALGGGVIRDLLLGRT
ncbi:MAG: TRIC cation channel family protein, partial [Oscillibacter sp.]|nr:TRIC cation channel family protein [Oscillibacter sp.]